MTPEREQEIRDVLKRAHLHHPLDDHCLSCAMVELFAMLDAERERADGIKLELCKIILDPGMPQTEEALIVGAKNIVSNEKYYRDEYERMKAHWRPRYLGEQP